MNSSDDSSPRRIVIPREVLLVEIERRCRAPLCKARNRIGLTKEEARGYNGFVCERCEIKTSDALTARDIPEWWDEFARDRHDHHAGTVK